MVRILVLDAERNLRNSLAQGLRRAGYEAESAATSNEAMVMAREAPFDFVIADVPGDGERALEFLRAVKDVNPDAEIALMSETASVEDAVQAMQDGAQNYLRKPCSPERVEGVVRQALEGRRAVRGRNGQRAGQVSFPEIIGSSKAMLDLLELTKKVADTDSTVLITGETGTGKELIGRAIHCASRRKDRVFSAVNSAAFPETLLESELFGHRRGAFTGASTNKKGLFEHAHLGTVFLDEVAEMPLSMQAKLLRFLQTGEIRPVGGEATRCVDVRLVTATNKDPEDEVRKGNFREDLYYRLAVIPIHVPPLRERSEDIPLLATHFLQNFAVKIGKQIQGIEASAMEVLMSYAWPGNVRELENSIERAVALCRGEQVNCEDLPARLSERPTERTSESIQSLQVMERAHIMRTLEKVGWNRKRAAELLQISTTTLWRRLREFGIDAQNGRVHGGQPQSQRGW